MRNETTKQRERRLNELYFDCFSEEQAVDNFIYLTNKSRHGGTTTVANIRKQHQLRQLGTLLKRLDPTAFYTD
jgi:hypothetical protein